MTKKDQIDMASMIAQAVAAAMANNTATAPAAPVEEKKEKKVKKERTPPVVKILKDKVYIEIDITNGVRSDSGISDVYTSTGPKPIIIGTNPTNGLPMYLSLTCGNYLTDKRKDS